MPSIAGWRIPVFDAVTASLLRSAPSVEGLDADSIPQVLTEAFAQLVAERLAGEQSALDETAWPIDRIANTYELIASLILNQEQRRAASFVAGTAHQIISRRDALDDSAAAPWTLSRDAVEPGIAAALLFLAAEQYADAHEASTRIEAPKAASYNVRILSEHVRDLASGQLNRLLERGSRWRRADRGFADLQSEAFALLVDALITGIEHLAFAIMNGTNADTASSSFTSARQSFQLVIDASSGSTNIAGAPGGSVFTSYPGPRHLASLLRAVQDGISDAALTSIVPPTGAANVYWSKWLAFRAAKFPFVWRNHREALRKGFHQTANSAVLVLPTGAGKTTVSSLKIAGTLARQKKVIFLAPTHALVEQLTEDLQELFPKDLLGSSVSNDFDLLLLQLAQLNEIEVMTPERCLAMLSFSPQSFDDVGLLVFDECHLLSPQSGKIRRALDSMLCVLAFNRLVPDADLLFLSAMLKNGEEFASWIAALVNRPCVHVDLLWKPSRQARGVVIYDGDELEKAKAAAKAEQNAVNLAKGKVAKGLRASAARLLRAKPFAIWGLQHNWLSESSAICSFTALSKEPVFLGSSFKYDTIRFTPNANYVASMLARKSSRSGLKTIVFVNTRDDAVSVAREISADMIPPPSTEAEQIKLDALRAELGDLKHAIVQGPAYAVPHHSGMLRVERVLAEHLFKRSDGAMVIVATPTLAQGLNLPAQIAILAGDKRSGTGAKKRENLEAHEILNAAARAGRAGHLANGVVLLIPEPVISYQQGKPLEADVVEKLTAVIPEDDRCVVITDPLEVVLDRIMVGQVLDDDVRYTVNRMAALASVDGAQTAESMFRLDRSLASFAAKSKGAQVAFEGKLAELRKAIDDALPAGTTEAVKVLSSRSGLPAAMLNSLRSKISADLASLPATMTEWVDWLFDWVRAQPGAIEELFFDASSALAASTGLKVDDALSTKALDIIQPGVIAWMAGKPFNAIEAVLGGTPDKEGSLCPRTRSLALSLLPRGISFLAGLLTTIVRDVAASEDLPDLLTDVVTNLSTAVRKGYDTTDKLAFANQNPSILSRVQVHVAWDRRAETAFG
jgi:superfamily II DNA/RNA helicase